MGADRPRDSFIFGSLVLLALAIFISGLHLGAGAALCVTVYLLGLVLLGLYEVVTVQRRGRACERLWSQRAIQTLVDFWNSH